MKVERKTKIVQIDFYGQTSLRFGKITSQARDIETFALDGFSDRFRACQSRAQRFGSANILTGLLWRSPQINLPLLLPSITWMHSNNLFVNSRKALSRQCEAGQRRRTLKNCKQDRGQLVAVGTDCSRAKADNGFFITHAEQGVGAFALVSPLPATTFGLSWRPFRSTTLYNCRTLDVFSEVDLDLRSLHHTQSGSLDRIVMATPGSVECHVTWHAGKILPLARDGPRNDSTPQQGWCPPRQYRRERWVRSTKIIRHSVPFHQEAIQVFQGVPFFSFFGIMSTS
jgi:hypothetical protein